MCSCRRAAISYRRSEVQLGGFGGQGIISAGRIIGVAAALYDKLEACFTQSYGPEAHGGAAGAQVIISSETIHYPHLIEPTSMIIMSQGAYNKYVPALAPGGTLLIDDGLVMLPENHRHDITTLGLPATQIAEKEGSSRAANTVMLGFWTALSNIVSREAMRQSVAESVPAKTVELNLHLFEIGYQRGAEIAGGLRSKPRIAWMDSAALVIGGGVAGLQAALDLAEARVQVHLVELLAFHGQPV